MSSLGIYQGLEKQVVADRVELVSGSTIYAIKAIV